MVRGRSAVPLDLSYFSIYWLHSIDAQRTGERFLSFFGLFLPTPCHEETIRSPWSESKSRRFSIVNGESCVVLLLILMDQFIKPKTNIKLINPWSFIMDSNALLNLHKACLSNVFFSTSSEFGFSFIFLSLFLNFSTSFSRSKLDAEDRC